MSGNFLHPFTLAVDRQSIGRLLELHAQSRPNAAAIAAPGRPAMTYQALFQQTIALRQSLVDQDIGRGDRIAIVLPNGPEMAAAFLGVTTVATAAPLNPAYSAPEFEFYLADLKVKAVIVPAGSQNPVLSVAATQNIPILELDSNPHDAAGIVTLAQVGNPHETSQPPWTEAADIALVLHTSGTTARPKQVPLTHRNLCISAANIATTLALAPRDRSLNLMPLFHIHGLVGVLLASLQAGGSVICTAGFQGAAFFDWLLEEQPTWFSAVPTIHQAILRLAPHYPEAIAQAPLRFIRSSSAPLPPQVLRAVEQVFGVPMIEAYGMTEAAHQMTSNPLPPGQRWPGSVGMAAGPEAGPEVAILDDNHELAPAGQIGEVVIRGDSVTQGYVDNPAANQSAFYQGWFRTGDLGYLDPEGRLFLQGRLKEMINRGGEKISPHEVEHVLLDHPAIAQAVAFAAPHPSLGEAVAAAVVLQPGAIPPTAELHAFLANRLAPFKVPVQILCLTEIPKGPTGKLQRIGLAQKLGLGTQHPEQSETDLGRSPIVKQLADIWCEVLNVPQVGLNDNFFHLGGDSISAVRVLNQIRQVLGQGLTFPQFFASPTLAGLAEHLEGGGTGKQRPSLTLQGAPSDSAPLSFSQQRLWLLDQLEPHNAAYNCTAGLRLSGSLQVEVLEQSLQEIVRRHGILRTTIQTTAGEATQRVNPWAPRSLPICDLSHLPESEKTAQVQDMAQASAQQPFDLALGPLIRILLLKLSPQEHVLVVTQHHIISDGWSLGIFYRELEQLYRAFTAGQDSPLPDLPFQFADFARWQRQSWPAQAFADHLDYWRQQLRAVQALLPLPTDYPRPARQSYRGDRYLFQVSEGTTQALKTLSRKAETTLFMTLFAVFNVLLYRYTEQDDIAVGSPMAGRNLAATEDLIGFLVNTVILRTNLGGNPPFLELLHRVRQVALEAQHHQDLPFEQLVEKLQIQRDLSYSPLFQVMFIFQNAPSALPSLPELTVTPFAIQPKTTQYDLTLTFRETDEGLQGELEYCTDLFAPSTIVRLAGHLQTLMAGVIAQPECPIGVLPLLTPGERQQLLVDWNQTEADFPDCCLHQLFEVQAQRSPHRVAVQDDRTTLTYRELDQRANRLAHYLQSQGVVPGMRVGICVERSADAYVGLLGILKANGIYVPLDPAYPADRLAFMISDAEISVLLTQQPLLPKLPVQDLTVIYMDRDWEAIAHTPTQPLGSWSSPSSPAYLIYTSGSTGQPKGVVGLHQGAINRLHWMWSTFPFEPGEICCQKTSLSFVDSVWELFGPLLQGIPTVIIPDLILKDPKALIEILERESISRIVLVPALLNTLIQTGSALRDRLPHLKYWISSGEALTPKVVHDFHRLRPQSVLLNLYGSSEVSADATYHPVTAKDKGTIPLGKPIHNTQLYVLDTHHQPVPIGVPGELYVGGLGLAQGYHNHPDLTANRFIRCPFSPSKTARLYRTGDRVRYRENGALEFMGRKDHQVKIRGYRIELGEIETVLEQHPEVATAVVTVKTDPQGDSALFAYILPASSGTAFMETLRLFLRQKLPHYMIPAQFIPLTSLPLTPNGKIDRQVLAAISSEGQRRQDTPLPARSKVEADLTQLWEDFLGIHPIGVTDNFFDLGGHSLLAAQLCTRIQKQFRQNITLADFFAAPTIAAVARHLPQIGQKQALTALVPLQPHGTCPPLFLVPPAGCTVLVFAGLAQNFGHEIPVYGLQPLGLDGQTMPHFRIEAMATHYIQAIRSMQPEGPYYLGGRCFGGIVAFEMAQQLIAQSEQVAYLGILDTLLPPRVQSERRHWRSSRACDKNRHFLRDVGQASFSHTIKLPTPEPKYIFYWVASLLLESTLKFKKITGVYQWMFRQVPKQQLFRILYIAHLIARRSYKAQRYPGKIHLFHNAADSAKTQPGWTTLTEQGIIEQTVPGDHFTMTQEPHVKTLADQMQKSIQAASG